LFQQELLGKCRSIDLGGGMIDENEIDLTWLHTTNDALNS